MSAPGEGADFQYGCKKKSEMSALRASLTFLFRIFIYPAGLFRFCGAGYAVFCAAFGHAFDALFGFGV